MKNPPNNNFILSILYGTLKITVTNFFKLDFYKTRFD